MAQSNRNLVFHSGAKAYSGAHPGQLQKISLAIQLLFGSSVRQHCHRSGPTARLRISEIFAAECRVERVNNRSALKKIPVSFLAQSFRQVSPSIWSQAARP